MAKGKFLKIILTVLMAIAVALFCFACKDEEGDSAKNTVDTTKYENFVGSYKIEYIFPYGGEIIISLEEDGRYEIYEMYIQTDGSYRQITEKGTYTKSVGYQSGDVVVAWYFVFDAQSSSGIQNGEYFTLTMGYYTENLWKDRIFFYGEKNGGQPTLHMTAGENVYKLDLVIPTYSLTYMAGEGGSVTGTKEQTVEKGKDGTSVTAVADYGYRFVKWSDGVTTETRQDKNVQATVYVTAEFELILPVYTVRYTCSEGGGFVVNVYEDGSDLYVETNSIPIVQELIEGLDGAEVSVYPDDGYEFVGWSDGVTTPTRKVTNVQENKDLQAIFKPVYTYTAEIGIGGGLGEVVLSSETAGYNNDYTVQATAVPEEGWAFYGWSDGVKTATRTDTLTEDFYVEAIFGKVFTLIATGGGTVSCDGVTAQTVEVVITSNQYPTPEAEAIAQSGYEFIGWFTDEEGMDQASYSEWLFLDFYDQQRTYYAIFEQVE